MIKDLKQRLGFGDYQTRSLQAIVRHAALSLIAYFVLTILKIFQWLCDKKTSLNLSIRLLAFRVRKFILINFITGTLKNMRISFKQNILNSYLSPDHSTFSRFRSRLSKEAMTWINNEVLQQFSRKGLTINEGIAIDARLIESASRPLSEEELEERKEKRTTPEGQVDKNGQPLKFSRDLESDWTVKGDIPHFGLKEHASVDTENGFILATELTPASHHDSP
jgi:hypothetical protein